MWNLYKGPRIISIFIFREKGSEGVRTFSFVFET